jgi:DNA damage-binding protein 1
MAPKGKGRASEQQITENGIVIDNEGSHLEEVASFSNIGPVHDAVLTDVGDSGQKQVVTCSGDRNTGSVHVIRTGAGFEELGMVRGLTNITNVWPLWSTTHDQYAHQIGLQSTS